MKTIISVLKPISFMVGLFLSGCDFRSEIGVVKNDSAKPVYYIEYWEYGLTDSTVLSYYESMPGNTIAPDSTSVLTLFNKTIENTDTTNYVYLFNIDTLDSYKKKSKVNGLLNSALIKKSVVKLKQDNSLDTIFVSK